MPVSEIRKRLRRYGSKNKAKLLQRFFKTGPGEYAEGDIFIGVMVPYSRKVAKEFKDIALAEVEELLKSPIHEERLTALLILVSRFQSADEAGKEKIYRLYRKNFRFVNNWDLVDLTAHHIIGGFLKDKNRDSLYELAGSANLWQRRMSVLATFHYIRENDFSDALKIADILLNDEEDLIHKATGWMLREIGKRDRQTLERFLSARYKTMPRTMLRYALEKFSKSDRRAYGFK